MAEGDGTIFVKKEPANVTISVWEEKVPPSLRHDLEPLPPDGKVLAVREPVSANHGYVHYLNPLGERRERIVETIDAIHHQHGGEPHEILDALAKGKRFELDYFTSLSFLDARRGPLSHFRILDNDDPAVRNILEDPENLKQEKIRKTRQQEERFTRSKRFKKKADRLEGKP